jgi:hypothetical protein
MPRAHVRRAGCTGLLSLEADDATRELAVDVDRLVSSDRVPADERVNVLNRLTAHDTAATAATREVRLLDTRVDGLERAQEGDKLW